VSGLASADFLLESRGLHHQLDGYVVDVVFAGPVAAFALGDGTLHLAHPARWTAVEAHKGAILSVAADGRAHPGVLTAGDDGKLRRVGLDGSVADIASYGSKWVDHVTAHPGGVMACAVGKTVHVFGPDGTPLKSLTHPSSVTGLVFDAKGKRIAASHYNGCSLWFVAAKVDTPRVLEWKGSHTGIAIHPAAEAVVSSMQENSLHGWRLPEGQHMRMSGYPAKTQSMGFTRSGKWLCTSGAESVVVWPFFGGGPMGKSPTELAGGDATLCTRVAAHPQNEALAAGFADGLVVLADIATGRILPVAGPGRGPISALAWSADGGQLAIGSETGFAALVDFSKR